MNRLLFLALIPLFAMAFVQTSSADVLINDARVNRIGGGGLTLGTIESGAGEANDYELIFCGIDSDGSNPFNAPSPGTWDELVNSTCNLPLCQLGIWGRFTNNSASEQITCSWGNQSLGFAGTSIRYSNVDRNNPIIDMGCSEIVGNNLIIPAVRSEPGAQVVFMQFGTFTGNPTSGGSAEFNQTNAESNIFQNLGNETFLILGGSSQLDVNGEGRGEIILPIGGDFDTGIKSCVISLRMLRTPIPTISEWGLISFAAFAGIAGFWFIRRRQLAD